jgi:hypothetical protein
MKKLFEISLILVLVSLSADALMAQNQSDSSSTVIRVTYYHGTIRCHTCLTIEQFSAMTMQSAFAKSISAGSVAWKSEDYEAENDTAAVRKYGLENQALIISKHVRGIETDWKLLPKIWDYAGDYDKFRKYVIRSIESFSR